MPRRETMRLRRSAYTVARVSKSTSRVMQDEIPGIVVAGRWGAARRCPSIGLHQSRFAGPAMSVVSMPTHRRRGLHVAATTDPSLAAGSCVPRRPEPLQCSRVVEWGRNRIVKRHAAAQAAGKSPVEARFNVASVQARQARSRGSQVPRLRRAPPRRRNRMLDVRARPRGGAKRRAGARRGGARARASVGVADGSVLRLRSRRLTGPAIRNGP
jgi:hypothetical protein